MSYETDVMQSLTAALRSSEGLKYNIKKLNENIEVIKYLANEIQRANELKELELGIRNVQDYSFSNPKTKRR